MYFLFLKNVDEYVLFHDVITRVFQDYVSCFHIFIHKRLTSDITSIRMINHLNKKILLIS